MLFDAIANFLQSTGFSGITWQQGVMILVSFVLLYLAIVKEYEPLLLLSIAFGMLLANLPLANLGSSDEGGLLYYLYYGVKLGIYPPQIFLGVGALSDFGPLIANPKSILLGAAAQVGIFITFIGALLMGMIPGMNKAAMKGVSVDEKQLARTEAIIKSMTMRERERPDTIDFSRRKRIAAGSGTSDSQVNALLKQFEQMQKMFKQFSNPKQMKKLKGLKFPF